MSKLGTGYYNLEKYNGEHFASWSVCGAYCSSMLESLNLMSFFKLVPGFDTMNLKSPKNERDISSDEEPPTNEEPPKKTQSNDEEHWKQ